MGFTTDNTLKVYTTSKDSDLYRYYFGRELKFGMNAGLQYGFGTYCTFEPPSASGAAWKEDTRSKLYGDNIYEFELDARRVFYIDYEDWKDSPNGITSDVMADHHTLEQFRLFKIKQPTEEWFAEYNLKNSAGKAMMFYRYMAQLYEQNEDGTINSNVVAFVYTGKQDGHTVVVWQPYKMVPTRSSSDGGQSWRAIDENSPEYERYLDSVMEDDVESKKTANEARTFPEGATPEGRRAYSLLMSYGDGEKMFLGNFNNIVIRGKVIDCKYNSNLPQNDEFGHYLRMVKVEQLEELFDMGFEFGKLDSGLKFGSETSSTPQWTIDGDECERYLPNECSGGLAISGQEITSLTPLLKKVKFNGKKLMITKCELKGIMGFDRFPELSFREDPKKASITTPEIKRNLEELYDKTFDNLVTEKEPEKPKKTKKVKESYENLFENILRERGNYKYLDQAVEDGEVLVEEFDRIQATIDKIKKENPGVEATYCLWTKANKKVPVIRLPKSDIKIEGKIYNPSKRNEYYNGFLLWGTSTVKGRNVSKAIQLEDNSLKISKEEWTNKVKDFLGPKFEFESVECIPSENLCYIPKVIEPPETHIFKELTRESQLKAADVILILLGNKNSRTSNKEKIEKVKNSVINGNFGNITFPFIPVSIKEKLSKGNGGMIGLKGQKGKYSHILSSNDPFKNLSIIFNRDEKEIKENFINYLIKSSEGFIKKELYSDAKILKLSDIKKENLNKIKEIFNIMVGYSEENSTVFMDDSYKLKKADHKLNFNHVVSISRTSSSLWFNLKDGQKIKIWRVIRSSETIKKRDKLFELLKSFTGDEYKIVEKGIKDGIVPDSMNVDESLAQIIISFPKFK